jgi:hypothetical protein
MAPFQKCVRWSRLPTKKSVKLKIEKKGWWNFLKIFSSETTKPISTKLCWNDHWVVPFQKCVQHFQWFLRRRYLCEFPIGSYVKLSSTVGPSWSKGRIAGHIFGREPSNDYFIKKGDEIFWKSSPLKLLSQSQPNFLPKVCPAFQTSDEDGRHSRT